MQASSERVLSHSAPSARPTIRRPPNAQELKSMWITAKTSDVSNRAGTAPIQERYGIEKDRVRRDVDDWYGRQGW